MTAIKGLWTKLRETGRFLVTYGTMYLCIGLGWMLLNSPARAEGISFLPDVFNQEVIGVMWIIAGIVAIVAGFLYRYRRTVARVGFSALQYVPLLLATYFLIGWLLFLVPPPTDGGYERGILTTISYSAIYVGAVYAARREGTGDDELEPEE